MILYKLTAREVAELIRQKQVSCMEATQAVLDRIEEVENQVGSFITVCKEDALKQAKQVQDKIAKGELSTPLAGVPMALKEVICTKGVRTTCGSKMLHNFIPPYDATVAKKLKEQGLVLVGKLNMDEFAMGSSTEHSYYKQTRNPWDLNRVPGGSSGGSVSSVAAGEAYFSLGSDTGGSIRQPAAFTNVVGLKPTYGTVSRYGLIAFASSLDQIGPLTKDVVDCAHVMNIIAGHDPRDATSIKMNYPDYTKGLVNNVKGLRIAIPKEYFAEGTNGEVKKSVLDAIDTLKHLGAIVGECSLSMTQYAIPVYYIVASAEASANLARFDGVKYGYRAEEFSDLDDMYTKTRSEGFGAEVKRRVMLGTYVLSSGYYEAYYQKAQKVRTLIKKQINEVFEKFDAIICPTTPTTAYKIGEKLSDPISMYLSDIYTVSANIAGIPGISIPCGFDSKKLPIGVQILGKALDELTIMRIAYTFQQNTEFHKKRVNI